MNTKSLVKGIFTILIGLLFCIFPGTALSVLTYILGGILILFGVISLIQGNVIYGIIEIALGVVVILCGALIAQIINIIIGIFLILYGIIMLLQMISTKTRGTNVFITIIAYIIPCVIAALGFAILFLKGNVLIVLLIITGVFIIIDGIVELISAFKK